MPFSPDFLENSALRDLLLEVAFNGAPDCGTIMQVPVWNPRLSAPATPGKIHDSIEPQVDPVGHNTMGLPLASIVLRDSAAFLMSEGILS
jgi:hypothetical protein